MTINDILESKTYVKENGAITFGSPKEYLEPFLNILPKDTQYEVETANSIINKNEEDDTLNISYPRVLVKAKLNYNEKFDSTIGLVYALEIQRPQIKVFTGVEVKACTNLTIFNYSHLYSQDILGNYREVYNKAQRYFDDEETKLREYSETYDRLENTTLSNQIELNEVIGRMLFNSYKTKLGTTPVVKASQLLRDASSAYYVGENDRFHCSLWNVYNATTQALGNADILEKPTKTVALAKILGIA